MATSETSNLVETVTGEAARLRDFLSGLDAETWASDSEPGYMRGLPGFTPLPRLNRYDWPFTD